jgi:hypothetical protein
MENLIQKFDLNNDIFLPKIPSLLIILNATSNIPENYLFL